MRTDRCNSLLMMSLLLPDARRRVPPWGARATIYRSAAEMGRGIARVGKNTTKLSCKLQVGFFLDSLFSWWLQTIYSLLDYRESWLREFLLVFSCFYEGNGVWSCLPCHFIDTIWSCFFSVKFSPPIFWGKFLLLFLTLPSALVLFRKVDFISSLYFFCSYGHFKMLSSSLWFGCSGVVFFPLHWGELKIGETTRSLCALLLSHQFSELKESMCSFSVSSLLPGC